jgi:hypothetical protein
MFTTELNSVSFRKFEDFYSFIWKNAINCKYIASFISQLELMTDNDTKSVENQGKYSLLLIFRE